MLSFNFYFQLLFQTVGWYLTSLVWNIGRGGAVDLDPDFEGAINSGLLDSDFAATNLSFGAGQVRRIIELCHSLKWRTRMTQVSHVHVTVVTWAFSTENQN
jgi:hypothetical protein